MDTEGRINDLGRQYITNTTNGHAPGVVTSGDGGRPGIGGGIGSRSSVLFGPLTAALFVGFFLI